MVVVDPVAFLGFTRRAPVVPSGNSIRQARLAYQGFPEHTLSGPKTSLIITQRRLEGAFRGSFFCFLGHPLENLSLRSRNRHPNGRWTSPPIQAGCIIPFRKGGKISCEEGIGLPGSSNIWGIGELPSEDVHQGKIGKRYIGPKRFYGNEFGSD